MDAPFQPSTQQSRELVRQFGTPLYVVDEATFRNRIKRYRSALANCKTNSRLCYASKANSNLTLLAIAHQEGCLIDVASEGEFRAALAAGVSAADCNFHGNNKSESELRFAIESGIGEIIIDNLEEIARIGKLKAEFENLPKLLLRLAPGVDPKTHEKISTGQEDSKFGLNIADGSAERGVRATQEAGLQLVGFHAHVGSQLLDPEAQCVSGERLVEFAIEMHQRYDVHTEILNVGGGLGVRHNANEEPLPIETYVKLIDDRVTDALKGSTLAPVVIHEPGRALIGEAGATLYTVGSLKPVRMTDGLTKTYVAVDGGMSDNPRPALYGATYDVERACRAHGDEEWAYVADGPGAAFSASQQTMRFTISGKHCETDELFADVELPADLQPGDVLRVMSTGAYNNSMSSQYNRYPRPAMVLVRLDGSFSLIQRRDDWTELWARESVPEGLI